MNEINICFATDERWLRFTQRAIYDIIIRKNKNTKINFYVLLDRIKDNNCFGLFNTIENIRIIVKEMNSDIEFKNSLSYHQSWHNKFGYLRLLIPKLDIFQNINRILYLDVDVLARKDLTELYNVDMEDKALACVKEYHYLQSFKSYLFTFVNTGFIVMNLNSLRKIHFTEKCITNSLCISTDNTLISKLFSKDIIHVDPKYLIPYHHLVSKEFKYENYRNINNWNKYFHTNYKDLNELVSQSYLWHFCCDKDEAYKHNPFVKTIFDISEQRLTDFINLKEVIDWKPENDNIFISHM